MPDTAPALLVVLNPAAGRSALARRVIARLRHQGVALELYETRAPGDATAFLRARATLPPVVVAAGGDGTVNEVVNGIAGRDVALGLIPGGTTNVLAHELGYPADAAGIADLLVAGQRRAVYFATVNGRRFCMMTGIGYDAWVVAGVDLALKKRVGKLAYVLSMLRELRRYGSRRYRVVIDGVAHEAMSAVITNGRHYAGSYTLSRQADLAAPALQALLIQTPSAARFLGMLFMLPLGLVEQLPFIHSLPGRHIEVSLVEDDGHDPVQADGDTVSQLPATIRVEAAPVSVLCPAIRSS